MTIVEMSAGGAVLIAVILLLRRCLLNRLPKWTFLLLWAVALCRLLVPFTLPSQLSVYTGVARIAQAVQEEAPFEEPADVQIPILISPAAVPGTFREDTPVLPAVPVSPEPEREPVSPLAVVWLTGTALCGVFFGAAYLWTLRRFWDAVPAEADFLTRWREEHPTLRPVQIKTCGAVSAPLAYGLIRPVILLPENTDWTDEGQLTYILTHEYVHIRRGDLLWKLLLTAALCVHWFNPLVWVMYFRANRDLELACDEAVVRILGLDSRKGYAYALLSAAESGFSPLCLTYTTKNHMEERIRAIMKMKKKSVAAILTAALLVAGVTAVFATSQAPVPENIDDLPSAVQTDPAKSQAPAPVQKPALADKSTPDNRVHPITSQPADTPTDTPQEPDGTSAENRTGPYYDSLPEDHLHRDALTPNPANCWGIPEGPIAEGTEIFAHNEEEYREMVRQLRRMGYDGYIGPVRYGYKVGAVLDTAYDGVQRTITPPKGILPDWTYPVNSKGETYAYLGIQGWLGYEPDLIAAVATNGQEGYMQTNYGYTGETLTPEGNKAYHEWLATLPNPFQVPVYDVNRDNIVGYFEVGHQISSQVKERIDELESWNVPDNPIPEGTEFTVPTEDEMNDLCDYLHGVRGIKNGDLAIKGNSKDGTYTVCVSYFMTKQEEDTKNHLADGYPVNSKGETYGNSGDFNVMGYFPDLIAVMTTSGKSGYAFDRELKYGDYQGETETLEGRHAFCEWQKTQPSHRLVKVYDVNRDNIIGYFPVGDGMANVSDSEELEMITTQLRNWGLSEEKIAEELGYYKYRRGMW